MDKIEQWLRSVKERDIEAIEAAREQVGPEELPALAEAYWKLEDWGSKCALIDLIQDHIHPSTQAIMRDVLGTPAGAYGERGELCQAIALCHLQGDLDRLMDYYNDRSLLARAAAQTLAGQEILVEEGAQREGEPAAPPPERAAGPADPEEGLRQIRALVKKGSRRLNGPFYLGVLAGTLLGPLLLIASLIPAVTDTLGMERRDITIMTVFGAIMTVLFALAIGDQIIKARRDQVLLRALKSEPGWLVWAYQEVRVGPRRRFPLGLGQGGGRYVHIRFCMLDKSESKVWLSIPEAEQLLGLVAAHLPHVSVGYSRELEKQYQRDPAGLKASPQRVKGAKEIATTIRT